MPDMKFYKLLLPTALFFFISINAQESTQTIDELNESVGTSTKSIKDSAANQRNINSIDKQTRELEFDYKDTCLLYTSPSPRDRQKSRMPSSA